MTDQKTCSKCKITKLISEFHKIKSCETETRNACKLCTNTENKERNYTKYGHKPKEKTETDKEKFCLECKKWKDKSLYHKKNKNSESLRPRCKECTNAKNKKYCLNNIDKCKERNRRDWILNKEKRYAKNKRNRYLQLKREPKAKMRSNISKAVSRALHRNNGSKLGNSVLKFLPYTLEELKSHIESLWAPWMNWNNYGKFDKNRNTWQIDHIIPQSKLPYDSMGHDNFKKCWSLENLRPILTIDNIRKNASMNYVCLKTDILPE